MGLFVRVNNREFRGRRGPVRDGFVIDADGFTGWDDGVDVRREVHDIPRGHGAFDLPGYLEPRVFAAKGLCYADTPERLEWWRGVLTGLLADGGSGRVVVENRGLTTWADARLATRSEFTKIPGGATMARYRVQFWAADPRKYGQTRTYGPATIVAASHFGNFPAAPLLTVTGAMPSGYTIGGPDGRTFVVSQALTSGHTHRIDMRTGRLTLDGVLQVGAVSVGQTWGIPGGASVTHTLTPVSGTGTITVSVLDTFI